MKQKLARYEMHKYWGKKPYFKLRELIEKYSKEGDLLLDPFSGYGVFSCEAYLSNRNIIANDLNPISNFINNSLLCVKVDFNKLNKEWSYIKNEFKEFNDNWFRIEINGSTFVANSILRSKEDIPLKAKFYENKKNHEVDILSDDAIGFLDFESKEIISDWYPEMELIENSRISAKKDLFIKDLFTKRTLSCHARLYSLINKHSSGIERELLKLAFSANLANCSKLVPVIKSRGDMSQGAWMTGFYIGETYIENNVLSYYENRLNKVIKGKKDFLENISLNLKSKYIIKNCDSKNLDIDSNSIDYIFIDPPYGSAVPYFEQSIIWNSWLGFEVDYNNEIVVSDSKKRDKNLSVFSSDIYDVISECYRVLKENKYMSLTFHSISGNEWNSIIYACIVNGFILDEFLWLTQKSFTPRQLNRKNTIKGDILITFKKKRKKEKIIELSQYEFDQIIFNFINKILYKEKLTTNDIFISTIKFILENRYVAKEFNLLNMLDRFFYYENGLWSVKNGK